MIKNLFYYNIKNIGKSLCDLSIKEEDIHAFVDIQRGDDITDFICRSTTPLLLKEGFCSLCLDTQKDDIYYELVVFSKGMVLFDQMLDKNIQWKLVAMTPLKLMIIKEKLSAKFSTNINHDLLQIAALNTLLFHSGSGINRVANYLWYDRSIRNSAIQPLLPITQEMIQRKTLLSKSQINRIICIMKEQMLIHPHYRRIEIIDTEDFRRYVSPLMQEYCR